ncbi:hypothetical protein ACS72_15650 [Acinetobacter sp. VT 511]|nr:hypothetical protein ACS72_15650 [Acinetobacter sp. VT 511]
MKKTILLLFLSLFLLVLLPNQGNAAASTSKIFMDGEELVLPSDVQVTIGIGADVSSQDGNVVVVSPIKGSPAEKAGIRAKDMIMSVNGESLQGLELNKAVNKIRGPKGSEAKVQVKRAGSSELIDFVIVRDDIDLETVYAHMEDGGIGVIAITQFSLNTGDRFKEELAKLVE